MGLITSLGYFIAAFLFIYSLKQMSSPKTARNGVVRAGWGMILAVAVTFLLPEMHNDLLIISALLIGISISWVAGKKVKMTAMPQMIALFNGMGGGAAALIAGVELLRLINKPELLDDMIRGGLTLAILGALIGGIAFTGSLVAFGKLQGLIKKSWRFPKQNYVNGAVLGLAVLVGLMLGIYPSSPGLLVLFFLCTMSFGVLMTLPIGGADMPVVISLYNALTGLAVSFEGYALGNTAMLIAGIIVGAAGTLLTQLMAKAMNRSLGNILLSGFGEAAATGSATDLTGKEMKASEPNDIAASLNYAEKVIIVPGYGLAVAQAQFKLWELAKQLLDQGIDVKFAVHPVAGRMPGHMNVLLAEAGVPYDLIYDLEDINPEFAQADVSLVIGANDVVNPAAKTDPQSPIYGMPILDVADSKLVVVIKRGKGAGFSGVENELFFLDNTRMLFGDADAMLAKLVQESKEN